MIVYLASGYSVINVKGREKKLSQMFRAWHRLISFYDLERGNKILRVIKLGNNGNNFSGNFGGKKQGKNLT